MIYNQKNIPKKQWRYGLRSSAATGCGWIATYNALKLLGQPAYPQKLIDWYERQLPLINGNLGTAFWGPYQYFIKHGYEAKLILDPTKFDALSENVNILFYHWRNGWRWGAHFICVEKTQQGFVGYNTYANSTGPDALGSSIQGFLKKRKRFWSALITIKPGS